jgi:hypothetical protein
VRPAQEADRERWDDYVRRSRARGFCWYAWRDVLEKSYRVETSFLLAEGAGGEVAGVAPLYFNRTMRGDWQGFGLRHGLVADDSAAAAALHEASHAAGKARKAKSLIATSGLVNLLPEAAREVRKTVVLRLREDEEATWQALRRETRVGIKRSRKHGAAVEWGARHLPAFYDIYARNMLAKNVPIYSRRYFENLLSLLGERADLLVVLYQERVIAGMIVLWGADALDLYIGAWLRDYAIQVPYQRMYWEAICEEQRRGLAWVDMGESQEGSGTFKFKVNFGGEPRDVFYLGSGPAARSDAGDEEGDGAPAGGRSLLGRAAGAAFALADRSPFWLKRGVAQWRRGHGRIV